MLTGVFATKILAFRGLKEKCKQFGIKVGLGYDVCKRFAVKDWVEN
jgi:hypothetical protein